MKTLLLAILIGTIPAWGQVPAPPAAPAAAAMPTLDKIDAMGLDLVNTRLQLLATQFKNAQMQEALLKADSEKIQATFQALSDETQKSLTGIFVKYKVDQSKFDFSLETKSFVAKKLPEGPKDRSNVALRRELREQSLTEFSQCLMRRPESVVYLRDPLLVAAEAVYQHAILSDFQGEAVSPAKLVKVFLASWDSLHDQIPPKVFKTRKALATLVADRADGLLNEYRAVRPVTPYALILGTASATGQYAVLERRDADQPIWYALRLRSTTEGVPTPPRADVVSLLRWLHLRSSEDERRHVRVLNCYLQSPITCEQSFPCERSIRNGLTLLLSNVVSGHEFPSPGDYCLDCQSEACR